MPQKTHNPNNFLRCPHCNGTGENWNPLTEHLSKKCGECNGVGVIPFGEGAERVRRSETLPRRSYALD